MEQHPNSAGAPLTAPAEPARSWGRSRLLVFFFIGWTLFVVVALWWLLRGHPGPSVWVAPAPDSVQPAVAEKFRAWFKSDLGLQRVYPWLLFGPYIALLVSVFPLQRGRLRLNLPLNVAACLAFVAASQPVNTRTSFSRATIVVFRAQGTTQAGGLDYETNLTKIEVTRNEPPDLLQDRLSRKLFTEEHRTDSLSGTVIKTQQSISDPNWTNLVSRFQHEFGGLPPPPGFARWSLLSTLVDFLAYGAISGLAHSVYFYRRFREREHRALMLESSLATSRLNALRAQLQPHFIFNSLNAVAALVRRDPRLAEATLLSLSDLLRLSLSQSQKQEISLREELHFIDRYMELQQTRFGEKLRFEQHIEAAALDCAVPTLLLQPLVENAIRHGIEPADQPGTVRLTAQRSNAKLVLTVEDDGLGLDPHKRAHDPLDRNRAVAEPGIQGLKPPGACASANSLQATAVAGASGAPDLSDLQGRLSRNRGISIEDGRSLRRQSLADPAVTAAGNPNGTGIGLANLRARLQTLYGDSQSLQLLPGKDRGVTVRIELPLKTADYGPQTTDF